MKSEQKNQMTITTKILLRRVLEPTLKVFRSKKVLFWCRAEQTNSVTQACHWRGHGANNFCEFLEI